MTEPTPPAATPSALACAAPNCPNPVAVQWRRRLTQTELDAVVTAEKQRRQQALALADPQQPVPDFGAPPAAANHTRAVYACGGHAIDLDLAAHVHDATCAAPEPAALPSCRCTPEPIQLTPHPSAATVTLPTHWTIPTS